MISIPFSNYVESKQLGGALSRNAQKVAEDSGLRPNERYLWVKQGKRLHLRKYTKHETVDDYRDSSGNLEEGYGATDESPLGKVVHSLRGSIRMNPLMSRDKSADDNSSGEAKAGNQNGRGVDVGEIRPSSDGGRRLKNPKREDMFGTQWTASKVNRFAWPAWQFYVIFGMILAGDVICIRNDAVVGGTLSCTGFFIGSCWFLWAYLFDRRRVDQQYGGYPINAVLRIPCSAAPSVYSRFVPTLAWVGLMAFDIGTVILAAKVQPASLLECYESPYTDGCKYSYTVSVYIIVFAYAHLSSIGATFSVYFTLTREAQLAMLQEAVAAEQECPIAEEIVRVAETQAGSVSERFFSYHEPTVKWSFFMGMVIGVGSTVQVIVKDADLAEGAGESLSAENVVAAVLLGSFILCSVACVAILGAGVRLTYRGSTKRMETLDEFLRFRISAQPVRLVPFYYVRRFYTRIVLPSTFESCNSTIVLLIVLVVQLTATTLVNTFNPVQDDDSTSTGESLFQNTWATVALTASMLVSLYSVLYSAAGTSALMDTHADTLKELRLRHRLVSFARTSVVQQALRGGGAAQELMQEMGPRLRATVAHAEQDAKIQGAQQVIQSLRNADVDSDDGSGDDDDDDDDDDGGGGGNAAALTNHAMRCVMRACKEDAKPTILGVEITQSLLKTLVGYIASAASVIAYGLLSAFGAGSNVLSVLSGNSG